MDKFKDSGIIKKTRLKNKIILNDYRYIFILILNSYFINNSIIIIKL